MFKMEEKVTNYIREHAEYICIGVVTLLGLLIRFYCKDFISNDAKHCLLKWYDIIKAGGIHSLSSQVGDYNILYQFLIYIFTLLPIKPLYAYKILSVIFDYALAFVSAMLVVDKPNSKLKERMRSERFILMYSAIIMNPLVFLNSACWAQCDAIWAFFIFASLYAFLKKRYLMMFVIYGIAISFKFQAVFVLPFLLILYICEKKYSILNFLMIPVMLIVSALPGIFMGRSIWAPFRIYFNQTGRYKAVSMNYNSFWNCVVKVWNGEKGDYAEFKMVATIFTVFLLGIILYKMMKSKREMDTYGLVFLLHITVYTCVLFLPTMHERYGYIYEITAIILMFMNKKFFLPGVGVILLSCITYGQYLFGVEYSLLLTSLINVLLYSWYIYQFWYEKRTEPNH